MGEVLALVASRWRVFYGGEVRHDRRRVGRLVGLASRQSVFGIVAQDDGAAGRIDFMQPAALSQPL